MCIRDSNWAAQKVATMRGLLAALVAGVSSASLLMNYEADSHGDRLATPPPAPGTPARAGTYVALVCPDNTTTAPCQLNAHVIVPLPRVQKCGSAVSPGPFAGHDRARVDPPRAARRRQL